MSQPAVSEALLELARDPMDVLVRKWNFRGVTSGFYGALTQNFRAVQPGRLGAAAVMIFHPYVSRRFRRCSTGTR